MLIGYARVSTKEQDTAMQKDALSSAGVSPENVYTDHMSGARSDRPGLADAIARLSVGDTLVFWKMDRVARSLSDLLHILGRIERRGAHIRSLTEPLDTGSGMGMFVIQILGAVAQLERSIIRERSIAGQLAARERGRLPGRERALPSEIEAELVAEYLEGGATMAGLACKYGVSSSVVKRAVYRVTKPPEYISRARI